MIQEVDYGSEENEAFVFAAVSGRGSAAGEGMLPGAVQVSPHGVPIILAVDHPVTGGYPVIALVTNP